jgi:hypothetical protein
MVQIHSLHSLTALAVVNAWEEHMAVILYFCTPQNLQQAGMSMEIQKTEIINDSNGYDLV